MMRNKKKFICVGSIIFLFIGITIAPNSTALGIVERENQSVIATTHVCGASGEDFCTVLLTKQQVYEIKAVFDQLPDRLSQAESLKETQDIFSETIDSLQRYGLLPTSLCAKEVIWIVSGGVHSQLVTTLQQLSRIPQKKSYGDGIKNSFCLLAGNSSTTHFATLAKRITLRLYDIVDYGTGTALLRKVALALWLIFKEMSTMRQSILYRDGAHLGVAISHGNYHYAPYPDWFSPATGWLWTLGVNGRQNISGAFWGQKITSGWQPEDDWFMNYTWRGCLGFTGLITYLGEDRAYYLGSALHVNVGPNRP
ncbi:MAG: hypothetical protein JW840_10590 [Candidatus Thermoplasmatota archaeon]|nr:hypothetical protein [Candidatus Thermoplasmatota archaeon]